MTEQSLREFHILIVDDEEVNVNLLNQILRSDGYHHIRTTTNSREGLELILSGWPDLVLLDYQMPRPNGLEILEQVRSSGGSAEGCPILVFTADVTIQTRRSVLKAGASDFITKPGDMVEILLRVRNFLELRKLQKDLEVANRTLEDKVLERTQQLWDANVEIAYRLAKAAEYRDDQTGEHINRVADLTHKLALQLGIDPKEAEIIRLAAPLHDVGKIAISDTILLKPGKLTPEEREVMQHHTEIGASILANGNSELLRIAEVIALTHHERWDGKGYPKGLSGQDIPLVGRILAVADVFDALVHERPYKKAWPAEEAIAEIERNAGHQFDPQVVEAMLLTFAAQVIKSQSA